MPPAGFPISYRIDAEDRIIGVNDSWDVFAIANDGEKAVANRVVGRPLWPFISDATIRELYRWMLKRVRGGHPVVFTYRCDAPDRRRVFAMRIRLAEFNEVEFSSTLEEETEREYVALLDPDWPRNDTFIRICSWCHAVATGPEEWLPLEQAVVKMSLLHALVLPRLTHGICPPCRSKMLAELNRAKA